MEKYTSIENYFKKEDKIGNYIKQIKCIWCEEEYCVSGFDYITDFSILFITSPWWKRTCCSELCYVKDYGRTMDRMFSLGLKCAESIDKSMINIIKESIR
jgi:hypothetical protein